MKKIITVLSIAVSINANANYLNTTDLATNIIKHQDLTKQEEKKKEKKGKEEKTGKKKDGGLVDNKISVSEENQPKNKKPKK